ncbi:unnamed protein product [Thelazia callipaeda]|uniref:Uncharacterized protein n=1 Tax=Thelazia callipaeda TaxID=103827 RepID=A0A0N5CQZ9_THECL|nr:unnamed protein product [Thelazia callipaeda]
MVPNSTAPTIPNLFTTLSYHIANSRYRRQLLYGYGYDGYYGYGYQWIRIIFGILIVIAMFMCCLIPCICVIGIWFAGWFGLRKQSRNKTTTNSPISTNSYAQQQPIVQPTMTATSKRKIEDLPIESRSPRERSDTYVYEEKRRDHYYHQPPPSRPYDEYRRYYTSSRM